MRNYYILLCCIFWVIVCNQWYTSQPYQD